MGSRKRGAGFLYAVAWLPCLCVFLAAYLTMGLPLDLALRNVVAGSLPPLLLGLVVLRLPRRVPVPEGAKTAFLLAHLGMLVAFVLASAAAWALLVGLDSLVFEGVFRVDIEPRVVPWRALQDALIYGTIAGIAYAWRHAATSRELAARAARAETLRARAELQALRSQLNPHFLFNTFHALLGLVRREPEVAEQAMERLGDLLRYSLRVQREGLDEVALREEWSFVLTYLELERLRLGDRLRTTLVAAPLALDCLVPSFALQTLVENAVRHAIEPRASGGHLSVQAREVEGRLTIQVEDAVPGALTSAPLQGQGSGLRLLRERLSALYDGRASLTLAAAGSGLSAVLELPARHAEMAVESP